LLSEVFVDLMLKILDAALKGYYELFVLGYNKIRSLVFIKFVEISKRGYIDANYKRT
jgi:hypothetical protein